MEGGITMTRSMELVRRCLLLMSEEELVRLLGEIEEELSGFPDTAEGQRLRDELASRLEVVDRSVL